MPDYNLGRAHGEIHVDYDGSGVTRADDDLQQLGDTTEETGRKITESTEKSSADYDALAAAARRLEQEVTRAAAAEVSARARALAAHEHLVQVQRSAASGAQDLINAQRQLTSETKRYEDAVMRAQTATQALSQVRRQLANTRAPDLTPRVDTGKFDEIARRIANIDKSTKKSVFGLNAFSGRLRAMIGLAAIASPSIAGLGVSLIALAGLAGVAAGALASLIAVAGTLATAFSGIGQVFKEAGKQAKGAGAGAAEAASQQRAAARQIEQAIRGVRDAEEALENTRREAARAAVQAAQQIVQAERQLRDAQFDAIRAQQNLTRARRDAARQIEDLRSQLTGGALDERQAILDVQRAQEELNQTLRDPRSSDLDRQQAILNLERQQAALENTRRQNNRLAEDQAETAAKGVEGSEAVVDAQLDVVRSQEQMQDAAVAVAEAVVASAQQQIDSQRDIRNATEALSDAQKDLAEAYLSAAEAGASGGAAMADAMANISPEAQKFVKAILAQADAWKQVKFAVQDALFRGLSDEIGPLADKWLPLLQRGMVAVAGSLNALAFELVDFLSNASNMADVSSIFDSTALAVRALVPGIRALLEIFLDLSTVGASLLPKMAEGFSNWATNLAKVSEESRRSGEMQAWMERAQATLGDLFALFGNLASIIGTVFTAFDQQGGGALNTLVEMTQRLDDFLKSAEGQEILVALGKTLAAIGSLLADVLIGALIALGPAFVTLAPLIQQFASLLGDHILVTAQALAPVLLVIAKVLEFLGPVLVPIIAALFLMNKAVGIAVTAWKLLNTVMKGNPFVAIAAAILALVFFVIEHWTQIKEFLSKAWEAIQVLASIAWEKIKSAIIDPIVNAFKFLMQKWEEFKQWISDTWDKIMLLAEKQWEHIRSSIVDPIEKGVSAVINFFRELPGKLLDFLKGLPGDMLNVGIDILNGLLNGLRRMAGKVIDFFKNLISDAVDVVMNALGIGSPSKLFAEFGEFTWQGYLVGVDDMEDPVVKRMVEVAAAAANAGTVEQLVPAGAIPAPRTSTDASASDVGTNERSVIVQTLNLYVAGNLDPTDPVRWRKTIKKIKKDIEDVDRSEQP